MKHLLSKNNFNLSQNLFSKEVHTYMQVKKNAFIVIVTKVSQFYSIDIESKPFFDFPQLSASLSLPYPTIMILQKINLFEQISVK